MVALKDLAKQIETPKLGDSKAEELKGPNVRTPSLIPNEIYLAKNWKVITPESDNPWMVVRFINSGHQGPRGGERRINDENPRIKDMGEGDFFFFERISDGKITELNAYQADDCLVHGTPPVRLTFFEISGVTTQVKPAKSKEKSTGKTPRVRKTSETTAPKAKKEPTKKTSRSRKKAEPSTEPEIENIPVDMPPVEEQEMPEATADNSERQEISPAEEEAVEDAIDTGTLESAEHKEDTLDKAEGGQVKEQQS